MRTNMGGILGIVMCAVACGAAPGTALALGPHEVALLVNTNSPASRRVAEAYAVARHVPAANVVFLDVPVPKQDAAPSISPEQFMSRIWIPALKTLRERGIGSHVLAWVYSVDFPVMVETSPPMSLTGMTFVKGEIPEYDTINAGSYASQLFGGPEREGGVVYSPQTFDRFREWLGREMPVPAMALGYIGRNGNQEADVIHCLQNGTKSDSSSPSGTVYFVTSDNVRSTCRSWQFGQIRHLLGRVGIQVAVTNAMPAVGKPVLGLMMGAETVKPEGLNLVPGAMAEHLTSAAAIFHSDGQTKLSVWVAAGATASSGAVTEPFANWRKFSSASFFVYYAGGCTMIESFYQSIRCPLQILLVGDPLAQPWASEGSVRLADIPDGPLKGRVRLAASGASADGFHASRILFMVDGRVVGTGNAVEWDSTGVGDGDHVLRVVAYGGGLARPQWHAERIVRVENDARKR